MNKVKCPKCGKELSWLDTIDFEGSLLEGWVMERMVFGCGDCETEYTVDIRINFNTNDLEIGELREN